MEFLRQRGVTVHMFERDLQDIILKENHTFLEWARRQPETQEPKPIKLSKYGYLQSEVGNLKVE